MSQVSNGKGNRLVKFKPDSNQSRQLKFIYMTCVDLGCTPSEENTGKTSQDKFMLDKPF